MKKLLSAILAVLLLVSLCACGEKTENATETKPKLVFTDDCGREVELPEEIHTIIPAGTGAQIVLYAIANDKLAGLSTPFDENASFMIPEEYYDLEVFGQIYGGKGTVNIEALCAAAPDVIIDIGETKDSVKTDLDELQEQIGIPCVHIDMTLSSLPDTFLRLGELLRREEQGKKLSDFCRKWLDSVPELMEKVGDDRVRAAYCVNLEGLSVLAKGSYHAELIDMLIDNVAVFDDVSSKGTGNPTDIEQLLVWDPDFIIFSPDGSYDASVNDETWQEISAIKSGRAVEVPSLPYNWIGLPPSSQRILGLIWLESALYHEYTDFDVYEEVKEYFDLFCHAELTREQFDAMTEKSFVR